MDSTASFISNVNDSDAMVSSNLLHSARYLRGFDSTYFNSGLFQVDYVNATAHIGDRAQDNNGVYVEADDANDVVNVQAGSFNWNTFRVLTTADAPITGHYTTTGAATTSFLVTIGETMPNTNYVVVTEAQNSLSSPARWISAKSTTTFTVTYAAGLTGAVAFDWVLHKA